MIRLVLISITNCSIFISGEQSIYNWRMTIHLKFTIHLNFDETTFEIWFLFKQWFRFTCKLFNLYLLSYFLSSRSLGLCLESSLPSKGRSGSIVLPSIMLCFYLVALLELCWFSCSNWCINAFTPTSLMFKTKL